MYALNSNGNLANWVYIDYTFTKPELMKLLYCIFIII